MLVFDEFFSPNPPNSAKPLECGSELAHAKGFAKIEAFQLKQFFNDQHWLLQIR
jgi:hypothetical protein